MKVGWFFLSLCVSVVLGSTSLSRSLKEQQLIGAIAQEEGIPDVH